MSIQENIFLGNQIKKGIAIDTDAQRKEDPKEVADIQDRDIVVFHILGIRHGGGDGGVGQPMVHNCDFVRLVWADVNSLPLFPQGILF